MGGKPQQKSSELYGLAALSNSGNKADFCANLSASPRGRRRDVEGKPQGSPLRPPTALTQTTYTFQGDKLLLEPKADLKERIGFPTPSHRMLLLETQAVSSRCDPLRKDSPKLPRRRHSRSHHPLAAVSVHRT
jgi:hypothetical protein